VPPGVGNGNPMSNTAVYQQPPPRNKELAALRAFYEVFKQGMVELNRVLAEDAI
jgi:hypothetical protein